MTPSVLVVVLAVLAVACLSEATYLACPNGLLHAAIQTPKHFAVRLYIYAVTLISFAGAHYLMALR